MSLRLSTPVVSSSEIFHDISIPGTVKLEQVLIGLGGLLSCLLMIIFADDNIVFVVGGVFILLSNPNCVCS
ncbi:uncharacterized protein J3R85_017135 [Psidium guajava]|nr:uncharacterized protein J3R85_017135 [Psidium guajava]